MWRRAQRSQLLQGRTQRLHLQRWCLWLVEAISVRKQKAIFSLLPRPALFLNGHQARKNDAGFARSCSTRAGTTSSRKTTRCTTHCIGHLATEAQTPFTPAVGQKRANILKSFCLPTADSSCFWSSRGWEVRRDSAWQRRGNRSQLFSANTKHKQKNWTSSKDDEKEMNLRRKGKITSTKLFPPGLPRLLCSSLPK